MMSVISGLKQEIDSNIKNDKDFSNKIDDRIFGLTKKLYIAMGTLSLISGIVMYLVQK